MVYKYLIKYLKEQKESRDKFCLGDWFHLEQSFSSFECPEFNQEKVPGLLINDLISAECPDSVLAILLGEC